MVTGSFYIRGFYAEGKPLEEDYRGETLRKYCGQTGILRFTLVGIAVKGRVNKANIALRI